MKSATIETRTFLKVGDVAAELGLSEQTVRLWCRTGILPCYRPVGTRQFLIDQEVFRSWINRAAVVHTLDFLHDRERPNLSDDEVVDALRRARRSDHRRTVESPRGDDVTSRRPQPSD